MPCPVNPTLKTIIGALAFFSFHEKRCNYDLLFPADVHIFNALISGAPDVRDKYNERWELITVSYFFFLFFLKLFFSMLQSFGTSLRLIKHVFRVLQELLTQMSQQKVRPNLLTFNSVLKALRRCGSLARSQALHTLNEMKAVGIGDDRHTLTYTGGRSVFY